MYRSTRVPLNLGGKSTRKLDRKGRANLGAPFYCMRDLNEHKTAQIMGQFIVSALALFLPAKERQSNNSVICLAKRATHAVSLSYSIANLKRLRRTV